MAWRFADALGTTPDFWIHLQAAYDLVTKRPYRKIKRPRKTG